LPWQCGQDLTDDRDGQTYSTVEIGDQCWMAENLAYLPVVHSNSEFETQGNNEDPGYGVYGYDGSDLATAKSQSNYSTYGVLYNWYAVDQVSICPAGWSVASDDDLKELEMELGMTQADADTLNAWRSSGNVGEKLKTSTWGGNNSSGFTALPGGLRDTDGSFYFEGTGANFWSSSPSGDDALGRLLDSSSVGVGRGAGIRASGFSVRCLRDI
jgi:uncharacterized protein (TIGR02145 family)